MIKYILTLLVFASITACNSDQPAESSAPAESLNFETAAQELCKLKCTMQLSRAEGDKEKVRRDRMNLKRLMDAVDELQEVGSARKLLADCKCD